jgi:hypothetical protein
MIIDFHPRLFPRPDESTNRERQKQNKNKRKKNSMYKYAGLKRALAALVAAARPPRRVYRAKSVRLANIAEGTHDGNITKNTDAVITERFLLAKIGSASDRVNVCGAVDTPIGVITDEAAAIGDPINVSLLGCAGRSARMVASAAISQGSLLEPAASGRVQTLTGSIGTHHVVGRALDAAAAAGDVIEVDPCYFLRVI